MTTGSFDQPSRQALLATLEAGWGDLESGRLHSAEQRFIDVLRRTRNTGGEVESRACNCLVTMYSREQRDFETLPLARRLVELATAEDDPHRECKGRAAIACAFIDLEDPERARAALSQLADAIPTLPPESHLPARYRRIVFGSRATLALDGGELAEAREALRELGFTATDEPLIDGERRWLLVLEAHLALEEGRADEAWRSLQEARRLAVPSALGGLAIEVLDTRATLETQGKNAARVLAEQVLVSLTSQARHEYGSSQTIRYLTQLGDLLRDSCRDPELAHLAYDLAGTAVLTRIYQLNEFVRLFPQLAELAPDDQKALSEYRERFKNRHSSLLESVAHLMETLLRTRLADANEEPTGTVTPVTPVPEDDSTVVICAWCERVQMEEDLWLPIGHFVPPRPALRVTHGMCPGCAETLGSEL